MNEQWSVGTVSRLERTRDRRVEYPGEVKGCHKLPGQRIVNLSSVNKQRRTKKRAKLGGLWRSRGLVCLAAPHWFQQKSVSLDLTGSTSWLLWFVVAYLEGASKVYKKMMKRRGNEVVFFGKWSRDWITLERNNWAVYTSASFKKQTDLDMSLLIVQHLTKELFSSLLPVIFTTLQSFSRIFFFRKLRWNTLMCLAWSIYLKNKKKQTSYWIWSCEESFVSAGSSGAMKLGSDSSGLPSNVSTTFWPPKK